MTDLTRVTAAFSISAGGHAKGELDITGLTPDEIAELIFNEVAQPPNLCHQCSDEVIDPEVEELTEFTVGGVHYVHDGSHWVVAS